MNPEITTLPEAQDADMQAMKRMFQRAADVIVEASSLGKQVAALQEQVKQLLADTDRMRDHITWLEQENTTLREQRDEAQTQVRSLLNERDAAKSEADMANQHAATAEAQRDTARQDATFWEGEYRRSDDKRATADAEVSRLKAILDNIWGHLKGDYAATVAHIHSPDDYPDLPRPDHIHAAE